MRRFVTWLLVVCFVLLGTGALQAMHRWQHEIEHAYADTSGPHDYKAPRHSGGHGEGHGGDESSCALCTQLHDPLVTPAIVPLIHALALALDLSANAPSQNRTIPSAYRIDCRGPPMTPVVLD